MFIVALSAPDSINSKRRLFIVFTERFLIG